MFRGAARSPKRRARQAAQERQGLWPDIRLRVPAWEPPAAPSAERSQALQELAQRWAPPLGPPLDFLGGLFSSSPPDPAYVNVVNQCLAERGYQVAGWK